VRCRSNYKYSPYHTFHKSLPHSHHTLTVTQTNAQSQHRTKMQKRYHLEAHTMQLFGTSNRTPKTPFDQKTHQSDTTLGNRRLRSQLRRQRTDIRYRTHTLLPPLMHRSHNPIRPDNEPTSLNALFDHAI